MSQPDALRRLGQAGFELESSGTRIVMDPFLSDYPGRLIDVAFGADDLAAAAAILVSHEHVDHFDAAALARMPESPTVLVVPEPLADRARRALPRRSIIGARAHEPLTLGGMTVTPVPSLHGVHSSDAYSFGTGPDGAFPYLGYVIDTGTTTIYHAGDGLDYPDLAPLLRSLGVTVALLPINGRDEQREALDIVGNMSADEAVELAVRAGVQSVVPMHYDMFANNPGPVGLFVDLLRAAAPHVHVLVPGLAGTILLPPSHNPGTTS